MSKFDSTVLPFTDTLNDRCPAAVRYVSAKYSVVVYVAPGVRFGIVYVNAPYRSDWNAAAGGAPAPSPDTSTVFVFVYVVPPVKYASAAYDPTAAPPTLM